MNPQPPATRPVNLGNLADQGLDVWAWCNTCHHHAVLRTEVLAAKLGRSYPVPAVAKRVYCAKCRSRDVETRPNWPATAVIARHTPGEVPRRP